MLLIKLAGEQGKISKPQCKIIWFTDAFLSAQGKANDLSEFYSRLVKIQEHHSKYPDTTPGGGFQLELASFLDELGPEEEDYEEEDRAYSSVSTTDLF